MPKMGSSNEERAKNYEAEMLKAIKKFKWMRWSHIQWELLTFKKSSAYAYGLENMETIKNAFEENRHKAFNYLLHKWIASDNPTLQIAAMRIVADEDERIRLNQHYIDHTTKGDRITPINIEVVSERDADNIRFLNEDNDCIRNEP